MKLEIGMYVRTNYGIIEKIEDVLEFDGTDYYLNSFHTAVKLDKETNAAGSKGKVIKASYNIIDLIEEGDYVNDYKILDMVDVKDSNEKAFTIFQHKGTDTIYFYSNEDIKSIVTKEQFESIQYVIKKERK